MATGVNGVRLSTDRYYRAMSTELETIFEPRGELTDEIEDGLTRFNMAKLGGWECHHIAVSAHKDGQLVGGVSGTAQWDWLQVELLWVEASEQRRGVGSQLLTAIGRAAASKGFPNAYVTTGSWQALGFYQKHGYDVFGQLEDFPKGHTTYFLKKLGSA